MGKLVIEEGQNRLGLESYGKTLKDCDSMRVRPGCSSFPDIVCIMAHYLGEKELPRGRHFRVASGWLVHLRNFEVSKRSLFKIND